MAKRAAKGRSRKGRPMRFKDLLERLMAAEGGKEEMNVAQMSEVLSKTLLLLRRFLKTRPKKTLRFLFRYRPKASPPGGPKKKVAKT